MRKFYQQVDMRSRTAMTEFLINHFRYPTMNSWNLSQSYACNLKIHKLGLNSEITDKLFDMIGTQEFFYGINDLINEFGREHNYRWQAGFNGRSGGYLVLYQGETKYSDYKSYCPACGQKNFKSIVESGNICGRCKSPTRVDYIKPPMQINTFPGRGTDDDEDFADWDMYELKERVKLVQEFDSLADSIVQHAIDYARNYVVEEEEILIPKTQKVLVPIA